MMRSAEGRRSSTPSLSKASAQRLIGALLAKQQEVWFTAIRYFDMRQYFKWKEQQEEKQTRKLVKIG
jgi:hypothetical protein